MTKFVICNRLITLKVRLHCGLINQNMPVWNFMQYKKGIMLRCDIALLFIHKINQSVCVYGVDVKMATGVTEYLQKEFSYYAFSATYSLLRSWDADNTDGHGPENKKGLSSVSSRYFFCGQ